jgi:hypothetical protein
MWRFLYGFARQPFKNSALGVFVGASVVIFFNDNLLEVTKVEGASMVTQNTSNVCDTR